MAAPQNHITYEKCKLQLPAAWHATNNRQKKDWLTFVSVSYLLRNRKSTITKIPVEINKFHVHSIAISGPSHYRTIGIRNHLRNKINSNW